MHAGLYQTHIGEVLSTRFGKSRNNKNNNSNNNNNSNSNSNKSYLLVLCSIMFIDTTGLLPIAIALWTADSLLNVTYAGKISAEHPSSIELPLALSN